MTNCADLYKAGERNSGVYTIKPDKGDPFDVYCDQKTTGGGWTVIQKRLDGSVDFYRGWADYKRGSVAWMASSGLDWTRCTDWPRQEKTGFV